MEKALTELQQPLLFTVSGDSTIGTVELFPEVWKALETLVSPTSTQRLTALDKLNALNAIRLSPLIAYIVATCLDDPDIELRSQAITSLAAVLSPDEEGHPAPDEVRQSLAHHLSQMRTRTIHAILQVSVEYPHLSDHIAILFNSAPYTGKTLAYILAERSNNLAIRKSATFFIGQIGFLDAIPELERIKSRLESRQQGQKRMPFVPPSLANEEKLLPEITNTIKLLSSS
jgi:hypothetical protein